MTGHVEAIHLAAAPREPVYPVEAAEAVAGRGLASDRYERGTGTFSDRAKEHELTLVEAEAVEAAMAEYPGLTLAPGETRRNVTTRGIRLNDLVGRRFRVGASVLCEGTRRCEPCAHLEAVTGKGRLCRILAGRGGLRARLLTGGTIRVGDEIVVEEGSSDVPDDKGVLARPAGR